MELSKEHIIFIDIEINPENISTFDVSKYNIKPNSRKI